MAEIITWLNTEPDKSGDRIIPKVRTKGVYDDKNKSLDEKMPFDFGVNGDKYGYYNSKGELIPFEKGGIKKWSELQEKPFEDIGHMLGVDDKQSLYAENYIVAEWDINKKYYLNDFCMYKKKIYRRINENPEGMDFDLAKPEAVFKTAGEFIMYPWTHHKYNNDLAYASWGINGNSYCLYMCSRISPDGARSVASGGWGSQVSPEPGYVDFLGERFWINFQWYGNGVHLDLSTRAGLPQITPVNKPDGGLDNLETLKKLLYAAGVWDGTEGGVLPPDESSRWALADSQYIFDYVKTIKNDFSWSEIKEKPFASIDKNTLEVQNDELIVKKQAWDDIKNKPFESLDGTLFYKNDNGELEYKNFLAKEWNADTKYYPGDYVIYNKEIYKCLIENPKEIDFDAADPAYTFNTAGEITNDIGGRVWTKNNNETCWGGYRIWSGGWTGPCMISLTSSGLGLLGAGNYEFGSNATVEYQGYTFYVGYDSAAMKCNGASGKGQLIYQGDDATPLDYVKIILKKAGIYEETTSPDLSYKWKKVEYLSDEITNAIIEGANEWGDIKNKPFSDIDPNTLEVKDNILTVIGGGGSGVSSWNDLTDKPFDTINQDHFDITNSELDINSDMILSTEEIGDTLFLKAGMGYQNPNVIFSDLNYSEEEQLTGKRWTDGKPIYQRTIYGTTSGNNNTWVDTGIIIPDIDIFMTIEKGIRNPMEWDAYDDRVSAMISPSTGAVKVKQDISSSNVEYTYYIVLQYTKTTDTAESPVNIPTLSKLPFELGIDDEGNYGYIKNGENTVTPFGQNPSGYAGRDVNYVFMSFKENISDTVSTSSGIEPIPFTDIESSGLTVEDNKVKLIEGHKYFVTASVQNPTSHYINICNKDGIFVMNGSDGNYQATTQSCIYTAQKDDVIYLGVSNNSGGAGSLRKSSTFIVIELSSFGSNSGINNLPIKSGNASANSTMSGSTATTITVTFNEPMEDANYAVTLSRTFGGVNWGSVVTNVSNKTKDGFDINVWTTGSTESIPSFDWVVIPYMDSSSGSSTGTSSNMHNYSTEEKVIGTWIDGKPIYEKTIKFSFESSSTVYVDISDDIDVVLYAYGFAKNSKYMYNISMYTQGIGGQFLYDYTHPNQLRIRNTNSDFDKSSGYVTVQYTKTTDTATT